MKQTYLLTAGAARLAIDLATPLINNLMSEGVVTRRDLHIVVARRVLSIQEEDFQILVEKSFGGSEWTAEYDVIARLKARLSARTGLSSREAQLMHPELLQEEDVMYWGSAIRGNLIVACSGVQPWYDEAISNIVLWLCLAHAQEKAEAKRGAVKGFTFDS